MDLPEERLAAGGWSLVDEAVETLFELPVARVRGHTRLYEDRSIRDAVREAVGYDHMWRFFFATRVEFEPPLAPGVGPAMVRPPVWSEARRSFADDLRERGLRGVERTHRERVRVDGGQRASLQGYRARLPVDADPIGELDVAGWLGLWSVDGEFRLAGGAYPEGLSRVADAVGAGSLASARECRDELFELIRAVN
jgi:hypothetical protein